MAGMPASKASSRKGSVNSVPGAVQPLKQEESGPEDAQNSAAVDVDLTDSEDDLPVRSAAAPVKTDISVAPTSVTADKLGDDDAGELGDDADELGGDADEQPADAAQESQDDDDEGVDEDDVEDDDDEDDEDDEEEEGPRKRRKPSGRNQFLDVEAEVDDEDEELSDDEEDLGGEHGFIQSDDETALATGDRERHHRRVDRREEKFTDEDAQRLADEYKEKYGRSGTGKFRGDTGFVPQRLLLPSVHDPSIFGINCRIGKEKDAVRAILRKKLSLENTPTPLEIFSAFQRDGFTGRVYIEAANQRAAINACKGIANLYANSKILLVPIKEYPDMFRSRRTQDTELVPGSYVRVKRGKYAGDLAMVENLSENGLEAQLRLVPRLDYGRAPVMDSMGQAKRKRASASDRPPQRLFSSSDATQYDPRNLQRRGQNSYVYAGDEYDNGFLIKDFKLQLLVVEGVNPTLEEITRLNNSSDDGIDLQALSESFRRDLKAQTFQTNEYVEVIQGELTGMLGKVGGSSNDIVQIVGTEDKYKGVKVSVPSGQLRKFFNVGDHVRVTHGNYKDDTGLVLQREKDQVTFLSDLSQTEVTVFAKDLKMASDIGGSNTIGKFTLNDLVQLNAQTVGIIVDIERESVKVLLQDGQNVTVPISSIITKVTSGRQVATDQNGRQIEVGDTVRETTGERREGTVIHLFHQYAFVHNRDFSENLGVFVNRITNIASVGSKESWNEKGLDLSRMNPVAVGNTQNGPPIGNKVNMRRILGQKIAIGGGSGYKGLKGLVKDANDSVARIELEARNKIVTVDITKLLFKGPNGLNVPFRDFIFQRPGSGGSGGSGFNGPPRTPRGGGFGRPRDDFGGRTPAAGWASSSGGKTPAWASGARTPAWSSSGSSGNGASGSRTPGFNSGSKTPAWNSGGKTPAWNAGGQTPSWNAGSKTPAWNAGGRTPAAGNGWDTGRSAPTPGASFYSATPGAAATPGVYDSGPTPGPISAPTPGAYARTPGAIATPAPWGDEDDDDEAVPKYEPTTP